MPPPVNDNFADAITLSGASGSTTGTNVDATLETGEPQQTIGIKSVWWKWTAPDEKWIEFDLSGSSFDTAIAVYTGSSVGALTLVGWDADSGTGTTSKIVIETVPGTTYRIQVVGQSLLSSGSISLAWRTLDPALRVARVYVEAAVEPQIPIRVARVYVEAVVVAFGVGGWGVGVVRMGSN